MITVSIDTKRANSILYGLREAMVGKGLDASHIIEDETKRLARAIVNFIPPLGPGGRSAGAQRAGEDAIKREVSNLISEAKPGFLSMVSQKWGIKDVNGYIESSAKSPLALKFGNVDVTGELLPQLHDSYRNRRGKIPLQREGRGAWNSRVLTLEGQRGPFIQTLKERVGMWKATWAFGASQLGGKFPKWISRHFSNVQGLAIADLQHLKDQVNPYAVIGSRFPGGFERIGAVRAAVKSRVRSIRILIGRILSDYKAHVVNGSPIQPAARKFREQEEVIE